MRIDLFQTPIWKNNIINDSNRDDISSEISECQGFITDHKLMQVSEKTDYFHSTFFSYKNIIDKLPYLKSLITDEILLYLESTSQNILNINFSSSWINVSNKNESFHSHTHIPSQISGIFYIETPPSSGNLTFLNPIRESKHTALFPFINFVDTFSPKITISPEKGMLVLFPSWLEHRVEINNSNHSRVSLAFNIN